MKEYEVKFAPVSLLKEVYFVAGWPAFSVLVVVVVVVAVVVVAVVVVVAAPFFVVPEASRVTAASPSRRALPWYTPESRVTLRSFPLISLMSTKKLCMQ